MVQEIHKRSLWCCSARRPLGSLRSIRCVVCEVEVLMFLSVCPGCCCLGCSVDDKSGLWYGARHSLEAGRGAV